MTIQKASDMFREFVKIVGRFFTTKDLDIFVLNAEKREWKEGKENGGRVMGVYIPTWKKPDDCLQCPFHRAYEDGTISCELPKSSPDDCKMVDVKAPHGHRSGGRVMDDLISREQAINGALGRMSRKKIAFEAYTLVLKHSIWDGGEEHQLEEPIAVRCMVDVTLGNSTNLINEMMDKMKHELLLKCGR